MDNENKLKKILSWAAAIGGFCLAFAFIAFIISNRDNSRETNQVSQNGVSQAGSTQEADPQGVVPQTGSSQAGNSQSSSPIDNFPHYDPSNLSDTYLIGFDYITADLLENTPSLHCMVRMDGQMEVEYIYELSNGEYVTENKTYALTNIDELKSELDLKKLYNLNPECPNPDEVCDGGFTYMYIYDKNDEIMKACGGFCPSNRYFLDILGLLYDGVPEEMEEDAFKFKKTWKFFAGNALYEHYGVFLDFGYPLSDLKYDYDTIVIDAQYKSEADIASFSDYYDTDNYVFSYINVGSLENFRDYYDEYADLALGEYENWEEEVWVNVADERWQDFILNTLAPELAAKGIDGFFVDNCDVYYQYPTQEILDGLTTIMEGLKDMGLIVIINGGDTFLDAYTDAGGNAKDVVDAINQETVLSCIYWDRGTFGRNNDEDREYFEAYLEKYSAQGIKIYLLEYTNGSSIDIDIRNFCIEHDYGYYISDSINLD